MAKISENPKHAWNFRIKQRLKEAYERFKALKGDPAYVARGMAVGVFVSLTPTIPFHTVIALALAFLFKASRPAAVIGVWFSNPLTIPIFYYGSYKIGLLILGHNVPFDLAYESLSHLIKLGWDVTLAMIVGGAVLGVIPAACAYGITLVLITRLRARRQKTPALATGDNPDHDNPSNPS